MTPPAKVVIVVGAAALAYGLYAGYVWTKKPEPGSRAWQVQQFRRDWKACSQFASKREEARKLLAWKPKPPWVNPPGSDGWKREFEARMQQESAQAQANLKNLDAEITAIAARFQADEIACLRELDWPDVQIESLKEEIAQANSKKK